MQCRIFLPAHLVAVVFACHLLLGPAGQAQPDLTRQDVYQSAWLSFRDHANEITAQNAHDFEWFQGFRGFSKQTNASFEVIAKDLPVGKGPYFAVADTKARRGDMIRVGWIHKGESKSCLFIYAGEESFPGSDLKHSFFIYPYRTRLEYNTVPARKHHQYLNEWEKHWQLTLDLLYNFRPDEKRASKGQPTQWMRTSLWASDVYTRTTMLNGTGKYTIYRAQNDSSNAPYLTLKKNMIFHPQQTEDSCFFAAYADLITYKRMNPYGYTGEDARDFERAMIRDEILRPASDNRRLAAAFFRAVLYEVDKLKDASLRNNDEEDDRKHDWTSPDDPRLLAALKKGNLLGEWWKCAFKLRWPYYHLEDLYPNGIKPGNGSLNQFRQDFIRIAKENLAADEPLLLVIFYSGLKGYLTDPNSTLKTATWVKHDHIGIEFKKKRSFGHWLKITGLREEEGNKVYVHFSTTLTGEPGEQGRYFADLDHILALMPRRTQDAAKGQTWWIEMPQGWKAGDKVPFDISTGGYVPILARLKGKAVDVREMRPN